MKTSKPVAALIMSMGLWAEASPIEEVGLRGGWVDGYISATMESNVAIVVNNVRVFLNDDTEIRTPTRTLRPADLRVGMMVSVNTVLARGGLTARVIYVIER